MARDFRDVVGGVALVCIGMLIAFHSWTTLPVGAVNNMGPGMFPGTLGCILAILGMAILIGGFLRDNLEVVSMAFDSRSFVTILLSILSFALLLEPFGLVPAIIAVTLISALADNKLSWLGGILLAAVLSVGAVLIFKVGLNIHLSIFSAPW